MEGKKLKRICIGLLVIAMMFALASCSSRLEGTYVASEGLIKQSLTFKEDNVVEVSAFGIDVEGEYEIDKDEITITYSFMGFSYDFVKSFKKDGNSIFVDGVEFVKEQ